MNEKILKKVVMDCPVCGKNHEVSLIEKETTTMIKGESIRHNIVCYCCENENDEDEKYFSNGKMFNDNLSIARNEYRIKHNLMLPSDIISMREKYRITQIELSRMIGLGDVTIARYESKAIQDEVYDMLLKKINDSPYFALECLKRNKAKFSIDRYNEIEQNIVNCTDEINERISRENLEIKYIDYDKETIYNGYKLLDIDKLEVVISYIALYVKELYKVKLMKMLWYIDSLYFKKFGKSLTGLIYLHRELGALPIGHYQIIGLHNVKIEEIERDDYTSYKILPNYSINTEIIISNEKQIIDEVINKFIRFSANEIVKFMHDEVAYKNTINGEIISYELAKSVAIW